MQTVPLWQTRSFVTAVLTGIVTLVLYFVAKYFAAGLEDVETVLDVLMPLALAVIASYTIDDVANQWRQAKIQIAAFELQAAQAMAKAETDAAAMRAGVATTTDTSTSGASIRISH